MAQLKKLSVILPVAFALLIMVFAMIPSVREKIRTVWVYPKRTILAKAEGDLTGKGERATVIKVQTPETLAVEVYFNNGPLDDRLDMRRIVLPDQRDGYFDFRGDSTNLVLTDIDDNGILEILAPAYDENLIPRLHVYDFDPDLRVFKKRSAE